MDGGQIPDTRWVPVSDTKLDTVVASPQEQHPATVAAAVMLRAADAASDKESSELPAQWLVEVNTSAAPPSVLLACAAVENIHQDVVLLVHEQQPVEPPESASAGQAAVVAVEVQPDPVSCFFDKQQ